ncbi:IclR family transcriptional regulator [Leifsonia xyli subsp. cynodontis DSM 46306]|jgi:DNA-binding IclR family transcriptional regulator|uniref:IclR family transcriptional regulator n=1 Tax=Leifsonia xyli subsp. cynodontis DSM 46306 TaxID=1389489 RepID=U3P8F5_LEIXC|nr:IclR family transcriptional regulator [Leifsonia xyli]AGW42096.1 IclR family transcriptional regulator [Leifsonia xyli subsp. cynodontis DSM 46306]
MTTRETPRRNSSGLTRDIEILELLGSAEAGEAGLGVVRVAQLTGRDKAVISRSLATLADAGLLERDERTLTYRLGPRLYALAGRTVEGRLAREARPALRRIVQNTRETAHLCVLRGGNVLTVLSELSPHEFRTTGWEGVTTAAWRTPSGRVLLSDWSRESLAEWYAEHGRDTAIVGPLPPTVGGFSVLSAPPAAKAVVTDLSSLHAEIDRIRSLGYALLDEELELGVVGASAPLVDHTGRIVGALNISAPRVRVGDRLESLGRYVAASARDLSRALGGEG